MKSYYQDAAVTLHVGSCMGVLPLLPPQSIQCCVTSPPYWGLRDYGTAQWDGGNSDCDHRHQLGGEGESSAKQNTSRGTQTIAYRDRCAKCGALRIDNQLGLEPTPEAYVASLVAVFREVKRVLRDDGTLWLNLGDTYAGGGNGGGGSFAKDGIRTPLAGTDKNKRPAWKLGGNQVPRDLKPKDLCGIPWRVAFALQADGWYLRSDIIWAKPNPMPESVTDRPTKAHEYIFLLSKAERYYYDANAIAEPITCNRNRGLNNFAVSRESRGTGNGHSGIASNRDKERGTRNIRSVWTVATQPYAEAHFATFPPDLIKPCILAGSPVNGTVLDPFAGAGTTLWVAKELGRKAVGIELNPDYAALATKRCSQEVLQFGSAECAAPPA